MNSFNYIALLMLILKIYSTNSQKIKYLNGLFENDSCELNDGVYGTCRKISDCKWEFERFRKNQTILKVCSYTRNLQDNLICCSAAEDDVVTSQKPLQDGLSYVSKQPINEENLIDFETCRDEFLEYRNYSINPSHYGKAMIDKIVPTNKETCDVLRQLNEEKGYNHWNLPHYSCRRKFDGKYQVENVTSFIMNIPVKRADRPNMAAIGWTEGKRKISYRCGGSILTEKFIVTAASCKNHEGKQADTVRIGDRFLMTEEDDEHAQQLSILEFILHPNYTFTLDYNDIALVKTAEKMVSNRFVVPSCIGNLDDERVEYSTDWTVSGYGEAEDGIESNVLMELNVELVSHEECNKIFGNDQQLPYGIVESQFCVKNKNIGNKIPNTCFGDSGSPLQYQSGYEAFDNDFNTTYRSTVYQISTVLGIMSFGISCEFEVPSVYTKLSYYRDWMKSVIKNN